MKVLHERPPEWIMDGCMSQFRVDVDHTLWTYGDTIYNPGAFNIPDHLVSHESTHARQQELYKDEGEVDELGLTCEEHYGKEPFGHALEDGSVCPGPGMALMSGKDAWWRRFLIDPAFRLEQEAQAYGVQYAHFCHDVKDRNRRAQFLASLARSLSGPLYQTSIKHHEAMQGIREIAAALK